MANIPAAGVPADDQLPSPSPVFGVGSNPFSLGDTMTEQTSRSFNKRKLAIGVGLATIAAVVIAGYAFDIPPSSTDAVGTIAPAERFVKPQQTAVDVTQGAPKPSGTPTLVSPAADQAAAATQGQSLGQAKGGGNWGGSQALGGALGQTAGQTAGGALGQTAGQAKSMTQGGALGTTQ
jgi:hypothetical protein